MVGHAMDVCEERCDVVEPPACHHVMQNSTQLDKSIEITIKRNTHFQTV